MIKFLMILEWVYISKPKNEAIFLKAKIKFLLHYPQLFSFWLNPCWKYLIFRESLLNEGYMGNNSVWHIVGSHLMFIHWLPSN